MFVKDLQQNFSISLMLVFSTLNWNDKFELFCYIANWVNE